MKCEIVKIGKWIAIALLVLPAAEILAFILVAAIVGWVGALALLLLTSIAGMLVLRREGRGRIERCALATDDLAGAVAGNGGLLAVLGGILLVLPGFITDLAGLLLLVPVLRRWLGATFRRVGGHGQERRSPGSVVDLAPQEWRRVPDPELPSQRDR